MHLNDAIRAMNEFTKVIAEARDMVAAGARGELLVEAIQHADELLFIVDEELRSRTHPAAQRAPPAHGCYGKS